MSNTSSAPRHLFVAVALAFATALGLASLVLFVLPSRDAQAQPSVAVASMQSVAMPPFVIDTRYAWNDETRRASVRDDFPAITGRRSIAIRPTAIDIASALPSDEMLIATTSMTSAALKPTTVVPDLASRGLRLPEPGAWSGLVATLALAAFFYMRRLT